MPLWLRNTEHVRFWNLSNRFWRCNIVLSRRPRCTCTKPVTVAQTFWIVLTQRNAGWKTWNNDHQIHFPYDWYKHLTLAIFSMAIFTHGVTNLFYELNFSNNNKFCNFFFNIDDQQSLRCYCNIQNFQVWETFAVLISLFSTTWVFCEKIWRPPFSK